MNTIFERFKCLFVIGVGVFLFISCATLPSNISIPNKIDVVGTNAKFEQCKMSVQFSGPPRRISIYELNKFTQSFSKFFKWELDGLIFEQYRLEEDAVCMCRDLEYSLGEIQEFEKNIQLDLDKNVRFIQSYDLPHSKRVIEAEVTTIPDGFVDHVKFFFPIAAPKCTFILGVLSDPSTSSVSTNFFKTIQSTVETSPQPEGSPSVRPQSKPSVTERLEELNNLLRKELITKEEYEQKRKTILEGL